MMTGIGYFFGCLGMIPCWCCCAPYKRVAQGNLGLVEEFGRFTRMADPGLVFVNPVTESLKPVNIKIRVQALPQQTVFYSSLFL